MAIAGSRTRLDRPMYRPIHFDQVELRRRELLRSILVPIAALCGVPRIANPMCADDMPSADMIAWADAELREIGPAANGQKRYLCTGVHVQLKDGTSRFVRNKINKERWPIG